MMASERGRSCWTCFVRRKGCDRAQPTCRTCYQLSLTCHGYGNKPNWMKDPMQQKQMTEDIRLKVKLVTERRRRNRALQSRQRGSRETSSSESESASPSGRSDRIAQSNPGHDASATTTRNRELGYTVFSESSLPEDNASPVSALGAGCVDPFASLPTATYPDIQFLVHHCKLKPLCAVPVSAVGMFEDGSSLGSANHTTFHSHSALLIVPIFNSKQLCLVLIRDCWDHPPLADR
jgi:hypothetical protein